MRKLDSKKLVLATHNQGKLKEFQKMFDPLGFEVISARELSLPEPEETGTSYEDNALLKARAAAQASKLPALADDSGLSVTALNGAPGIYSARWCGEARDPMVGMTRIHGELGDNKDRSAAFVCTLALVWPDGHAEIVGGKCSGQIVWPPRGEKGHGYDPFFVPDEGDGRTFGEMDANEKDALSHRGRAIEALTILLKETK